MSLEPSSPTATTAAAPAPLQTAIELALANPAAQLSPLLKEMQALHFFSPDDCDSPDWSYRLGSKAHEAGAFSSVGEGQTFFQRLRDVARGEPVSAEMENYLRAQIDVMRRLQDLDAVRSVAIEAEAQRRRVKNVIEQHEKTLKHARQKLENLRVDLAHHQNPANLIIGNECELHVNLQYAAFVVGAERLVHLFEAAIAKTEQDLAAARQSLAELEKR